VPDALVAMSAPAATPGITVALPSLG
jgi:hypothetical protein